MKFAGSIFFLMIFCTHVAYPQARYNVRVEKFNSKPRLVDENNLSDNADKEKIDPKSTFNPNEKGNEIDEFFYIKWSATRRLNFNDFQYDKAYYRQLIPEKDTDLLRSVYPNYQSFYSTLSKRMASDTSITEASKRQDSINHRLNAKLDSLYLGYAYSVSVDMNLSFEKNIDSPAASVLTISPAIYAINDTTFYYNIVTIFSKYESWMIVKSKDILQHEQIHFDIFELYSRKLRKYWVELLRKNHAESGINDITLKLTPVYDQLYQQLYTVQAEFDAQTAALTANNESLLPLNTEWERKVTAELDSLKDYSEPEGTITLK